MCAKTTFIPSLYIILGQTYGERLRDLPLLIPVWIVMSPVNEPAVRDMRAIRKTDNHLIGITVIAPDSTKTTEDFFIEQMPIIDLHHGEYSTETPYTPLSVIGVECAELVRKALAKYGFHEFVANGSGFIAMCSISKSLAT